ncbi:MAG: serine hydrolase domain-containing protein [Litorimonas sp.]
MDFRYTASLLLPFVLLIGGCAAAEAPPAEPAPSPVVETTRPTFDAAAMDAILSGAVERGEVIGVSALVFDEGEVVYQGAFGLRDREAGLPVTDDTVWRIFSMTKPITSALIMDLIEDGLVALDDPVADYIPELAAMQVASLGEDGRPVFTPQARPMTVEDLLLHRAGLSYGIFGGNPIEDAYAAADLFRADEGLGPKMERLSRLPLIAQPGEMWMYSYSIDVLGRIAEIVTNQALDELMAERIFEPLGMTDTGFFVRPEAVDRFAALYVLQPDGSFARLDPDPDNVFAPDFTVDHDFHMGGGGLVSTQRDYARFAQMILDGGVYEGTRVLEPETVALMLQDHLGEGFPSVLPWLGGDTNVGFGYGGSVQKSATAEQQRELGQYAGQWGWGGAARTDMYVDPENDAFGIIMLQFFGGPDPQIHADFQAEALRQTRDDRP